MSSLFVYLVASRDARRRSSSLPLLVIPSGEGRWRSRRKADKSRQDTRIYTLPRFNRPLFLSPSLGVTWLLTRERPHAERLSSTMNSAQRDAIIYARERARFFASANDANVAAISGRRDAKLAAGWLLRETKVARNGRSNSRTSKMRTARRTRANYTAVALRAPHLASLAPPPPLTLDLSLSIPMRCALPLPLYSSAPPLRALRCSHSFSRSLFLSLYVNAVRATARSPS